VPPLRCEIRDVGEDGDEDLRCRFPFDAVEGLPSFPVKRVCVNGGDVGAVALRGCDEVGIVYLPKSVVRGKPLGR
jgi:hypothetical protein